MDKAKMDQTTLLENIIKFNNKYRPRSQENKDKKRNTFGSVNALYKGPKSTLNKFRSGIFPIKEMQGKGRPMLRYLDVIC